MPVVRPAVAVVTAVLLAIPVGAQPKSKIEMIVTEDHAGTRVALRAGQDAGLGPVHRDFRSPRINNAGQVLARVAFAPFQRDVAGKEALLLHDGQQLKLLALTGTATPDEAPSTFSDSFVQFSLNDAGQAAFYARVLPEGKTTIQDSVGGIYFYSDATGLLPVALNHQPLNGKPNRDLSYGGGISAEGQVAFNTSHGIALWTPPPPTARP